MMCASRIVGIVALSGCLLLCGGCLVVKGHSIDERGVKVSQSTLSQVKPGDTPETWLLATLGEPTCRRDVDDHTHILRYDHTVTDESGGAVFLIFAGGESEETTTSTIFEITDGVVSKYWTES